MDSAVTRRWLREKGFDPEGDLCAAIKCKEYGGATTAMWKAASSGELGVCRFLWENGAASTMSTKSSYGNTPMWAACCSGHLKVAKWLFKLGAAKDIRTWDSWNQTPFFIACCNGYLDVAKWLCEVGAADDIHTENSSGITPMQIAGLNDQLRIVQWLILESAANNNEGHVDPGILQRDARAPRPALIITLKLLINESTVFTSLVLSAVSIRDAQAQAQEGAPAHRRRVNPDCALRLLRGHEGSVLRLIADFAGVVYGRQLRNAREALRIMVA